MFQIRIHSLNPQETDEISDNEDNDSAELQAINHIHDILDLPVLPAPGAQHCHSPVSLSHGSMDEKVSVKLGQQNRLDVDVTWRVYEGLGHWYKVPDEIDDIVKFLKEKVGVPVPVEPSAEPNS